MMHEEIRQDGQAAQLLSENLTEELRYRRPVCASPVRIADEERAEQILLTGERRRLRRRHM